MGALVSSRICCACVGVGVLWPSTGEHKIDDMLTAKEQLMKKRQEIALVTKRQRAAIVKAMEEAKRKKNWAAASTTIQAAMTSTQGLFSATDGSPQADSTAKRQRVRVFWPPRAPVQCSHTAVRVPLQSVTRQPNRERREREQLMEERAASAAALHYAAKAEAFAAETQRQAQQQQRGRPSSTSEVPFRSPYELVELEHKGRQSKSKSTIKPVQAFAHVSSSGRDGLL